MAFCGSCGAAVNDGVGFCGSCGKSIGAASVSAGATPQGSGGAVAASSINAPGLTQNVAGALTYILGFITGIIFLAIDPYKNDRFVRFHALQSIFFSLAYIIFSIAWGVVWRMIASVTSGPVLFISIPLRLLISFAIFFYWLFVMYQAYNQREYHIPFIGDLAAKQVP
jgi:uncharacterized membrane protein